MDQSADQADTATLVLLLASQPLLVGPTLALEVGEVDAHDPYRELYGSDLPADPR